MALGSALRMSSSFSLTLKRSACWQLSVLVSGMTAAVLDEQ